MMNLIIFCAAWQSDISLMHCVWENCYHNTLEGLLKPRSLRPLQIYNSTIASMGTCCLQNDEFVLLR